MRPGLPSQRVPVCTALDKESCKQLLRLRSEFLPTNFVGKERETLLAMGFCPDCSAPLDGSTAYCPRLDVDAHVVDEVDFCRSCGWMGVEVVASHSSDD
jgi:hypothetical protein